MEEIFTWAKSNSKEEIDSFEELFRLYYPRLIRYAGFFIKNSEEAEDLVQDVFFQLWKNRKKINQEKSISAFIFTQLKNKCLNSIKRKIVEEKYKDFQGNIESQKLHHLSMDGETDFVSMKEQLSIQLDNIISKMPEKCGLVFKLRWIEGKKIRQIAEELEISTTMVDKHIAKGLQIARQKMSPDLFLLFCITTD